MLYGIVLSVKPAVRVSPSQYANISNWEVKTKQFPKVRKSSLERYSHTYALERKKTYSRKISPSETGFLCLDIA